MSSPGRVGHHGDFCAFLKVVPLPRFERGACGLGIRRSILLSYRGDPVGKEVYLTRFSAGVNTGQA